MAVSPNLNSSDVVKLTITSDGSALPETIQIISVEVSRTVNKISFAKIVALDGNMPEGDFPASDGASFVPGAKIEIKAGYGSEETLIFKGIVVKHAIKISGDNDARLTIECRHAAVALTVGRKNANNINATDSDVISGLISGCSGLSGDVTSTSTQYKELVQYYSTDWDFILSRAEANGFLVITGDDTVTVKAPQTDGSPVLTVTYGIDLMSFQAEIDARTQLTSVQSVAWDPGTQSIVEQQAAPQTLNAQGNLQSATLANVIGLSSLRLQTPVALESAALKTWADARQLKAGLSRIRGSMSFQGSALALPGTLIELKGVGERFNGNVFVSAVEHRIVNGNWITEVEFGLAAEWFTDRVNQMGESASGLVPGVTGLQIGVVKKLDEDPSGQNRIQVSIPVLKAETEGVWARLAKFYGSENVGAFFIPEIGDEVIIGYFNNDPSHPVILGSLYSSKRKPPYALTAENYTKAIVTKGLLKIEFDDDKKVVTIVTPQKNTIVISDDDKSIKMKDQNDNKVEMTTSGILLDSPFDIVMKAKGNIKMTATGNIESTATADVKTEGLNINSNAKVGLVAKGSATAELSASGQVTVKGAMVMIN